MKYFDEEKQIIKAQRGNKVSYTPLYATPLYFTPATTYTEPVKEVKKELPKIQLDNKTRAEHDATNRQYELDRREDIWDLVKTYVLGPVGWIPGIGDVTDALVNTSDRNWAGLGTLALGRLKKVGKVLGLGSRKAVEREARILSSNISLRKSPGKPITVEYKQPTINGKDVAGIKQVKKVPTIEVNGKTIYNPKLTERTVSETVTEPGGFFINGKRIDYPMGEYREPKVNTTEKTVKEYKGKPVEVKNEKALQVGNKYYPLSSKGERTIIIKPGEAVPKGATVNGKDIDKIVFFNNNNLNKLLKGRFRRDSYVDFEGDRITGIRNPANRRRWFGIGAGATIGLTTLHNLNNPNDPKTILDSFGKIGKATGQSFGLKVDSQPETNSQEKPKNTAERLNDFVKATGQSFGLKVDSQPETNSQEKPKNTAERLNDFVYQDVLQY